MESFKFPKTWKTQSREEFLMNLRRVHLQNLLLGVLNRESVEREYYQVSSSW